MKLRGKSFVWSVRSSRTPLYPTPISTQITMFPLFTVFTFFYRGVGWGGWGVAKKMPVKHNKKTAPATTTVSLGEPLSEAPARTWRLSHSIYTHEPCLTILGFRRQLPTTRCWHTRECLLGARHLLLWFLHKPSAFHMALERA